MIRKLAAMLALLMVFPACGAMAEEPHLGYELPSPTYPYAALIAGNRDILTDEILHMLRVRAGLEDPGDGKTYIFIASGASYVPGAPREGDISWQQAFETALAAVREDLDLTEEALHGRNVVLGIDVNRAEGPAWLVSFEINDPTLTGEITASFGAYIALETGEVQDIFSYKTAVG